MIAENFREFIDELIKIAADVLNHVFKVNTVTDRDSTRRANCAKQVTEGQCQKPVLLLFLK